MRKIDEIVAIVRTVITEAITEAFEQGREAAALDIEKDEGFEHRYEQAFAARIARGVGVTHDEE